MLRLRRRGGGVRRFDERKKEMKMKKMEMKKMKKYSIAFLFFLWIDGEGDLKIVY